MVRLLPDVGTVPANVTVPVTGATTVEPGSPARSTPRCCPAAYGWAGSKSNGWRTAPEVGHVQAPAEGAIRSAAKAARSRMRRIGTTFVV
jgi:hypothetical protein